MSNQMTEQRKKIDDVVSRGRAKRESNPVLYEQIAKILSGNGEIEFEGEPLNESVRYSDDRKNG